MLTGNMTVCAEETQNALGIGVSSVSEGEGERVVLKKGSLKRV